MLRARFLCLVVTSFIHSFIVRSFAHALDRSQYNLIPFFFVVACHAYHLIAFNNLTMDDYLHHFIFGGFICTFAVLDAWGPVQNLVAFFLSG